MKRICENFKQVLIAIDQLMYCSIAFVLSIFNKNVGVYADLTISAQAYRLEQKGYLYGKILRVLIDAIFRVFEKEHCKNSWLSEVKGSHLPNDCK